MKRVQENKGKIRTPLSGVLKNRADWLAAFVCVDQLSLSPARRRPLGGGPRVRLARGPRVHVSLQRIYLWPLDEATHVVQCPRIYSFPVESNTRVYTVTLTVAARQVTHSFASKYVFSFTGLVYTELIN